MHDFDSSPYQMQQNDYGVVVAAIVVVLSLRLVLVAAAGTY